MIRPCNIANCPALALDGTSRCAEHTTKDRRPSASRRGYDTRWRKTRAAHLLHNPTCVTCGQPATDVDHIDGHGPHGPQGHDPANLRSLCHACHSQRTARDQPGGWNQ